MWSKLSSSVGGFFGGGRQQETQDEIALAVLESLMLQVLMGWAHGDAAAGRRVDHWLRALDAQGAVAVKMFWRARR